MSHAFVLQVQPGQRGARHRDGGESAGTHAVQEPDSIGHILGEAARARAQQTAWPGDGTLKTNGCKRRLLGEASNRSGGVGPMSCAAMMGGACRWIEMRECSGRNTESIDKARAVLVCVRWLTLAYPGSTSSGGRFAFRCTALRRSAPQFATRFPALTLWAGKHLPRARFVDFTSCKRHKAGSAMAARP